ncbi:hypothetical protein BF49_4290 [Bradyrhizobium sp.]|nr:hypothetical protein BF49_4290 [Bradyrhizobium sp.]
MLTSGSVGCAWTIAEFDSSQPARSGAATASIMAMQADRA